MAMLNILVVDAVLFFNVGKSMDADQVKQTVQLILEEYYYFKPEDFKLCFKKAMKGHYGKVYDRIDGPVIFEWLNQHDFERTQIVEEVRSGQNRELKKLEAQPLMPKDELLDSPDLSDEDKARFEKNLNIWKERLEANKHHWQRPEDKEPAVNTNPVYQMHQRWMRQFDAIWERQQYPPKRMIMRYGKMPNPFYDGNKDKRKTIPRLLDVNSFLEHKQWQYQQAIERKSNN